MDDYLGVGAQLSVYSLSSTLSAENISLPAYTILSGKKTFVKIFCH